MKVTSQKTLLYKVNLRQLKKISDIKNLEVIAAWLTKNNNSVTTKEIAIFAIILGISPTELKTIMASMGIRPVTLEHKETVANIWNPINESESVGVTKVNKKAE
jgi:site-specific recombinase